MIWYKEKKVADKTIGSEVKCFFHTRNSSSTSPKVLWDNVLFEISECIRVYSCFSGKIGPLRKRIILLDEKRYNLSDDEKVVSELMESSATKDVNEERKNNEPVLVDDIFYKTQEIN